jgi:DNA-binding MarR family transcriptional regulator
MEQKPWQIVSMESIIISMETIPLNNDALPSKLESHLGYWLRRVSSAVSGAFASALQEKQASVAEWVLLRELHERGQAAPGELADCLGLTRGAVSKIVDKLDAKGWVQTEAKEGDNRFRLLSLTRAGRRNLPVLAEIADQNDAHYFDCLSSREKSVLRALLIKLADHNHIHDVPTE